MDGKELLAHALIHSEFGYAKDNPIGNLISVDNDIVKNMVSIIGEDVLSLSMGTDKAISKEERALKSKYEGFARRALLGKDASLHNNLKKAIGNRKS